MPRPRAPPATAPSSSTGAPAGPIDLRAMAGDPASGLRSARAQVEVAAGEEEAQAQIVFESGFALSGTVTRNGQPVDGANVSASLGGGGPFTSARTSASGAYRLEGLSAGTYNVSASQGGAPRTQSITIDGDATLDLAIPFARLGGVVLDGATHQPLADVVVQATARTESRGPRSASTDSNGRFGLEDLEAVPYTLAARKSGYQVATREVTPVESGSDDLVVELTRGAGISIEVRDASFGVPLHAVQARATDGAGAVVFAGGIALDSDGRGEIPLPASGQLRAVRLRQRLRARDPGRDRARARRRAPPDRGRRHRDPRRGDHPGRRQRARADPDHRAASPIRSRSSRRRARLTLTAPVRRLENLAPGAYVLQVEGAEPRPFEVRADTLTTVALP